MRYASTTHVLWRLFFCIVLTAGIGTRGAVSQAQDRQRQPVFFTISGGISRGSYQAGVNWGLVEFFKNANHDATLLAENPYVASLHRRMEREGFPAYEIMAMAGASAGNINSVLTALEWCRQPGASIGPEASLFWKIWTRTGWEQLFPQHHGRPIAGDAFSEGIFHRQYFREHHLPAIEHAMSEGPFRESCSVDLGITLTRLDPDTVDLGALKVVTQRMVSLYRVRADSTSTRLELRPHRDTENDGRFGRVAFMPTDERGVISSKILFDFTEASSAFPFAFAPKTLYFCRPGELLANGVCFPERQNRTDFIDGGVFDNYPLDVAYRLYEHAAVRERFDEGDRFTDPLLIYIDPDNLRSASNGQLALVMRKRPSRGIASLGKLLRGAVPSARQHELESLSRNIDSQRLSYIRLTSRFHPIVGTYLASFAGFFGEPFRAYDFYAGINDAFHFIAETIICADETRGAYKSDCTASVVRDLTRFMPLDIGGRLLLRKLFQLEYPGRVLNESVISAEAIGSDLEATVVRVAIADAVWRQHAQAADAACARLPFEERVLCEDGFTSFVGLMIDEDPRVEPLIKKWANACSLAPGEPCRADGTLVGLLENPSRKMSRLIDEALEQAWRVEHSHGSLATERLTEFLHFAYLSRQKTHDRGLRIRPSSIPAYERLTLGGLFRTGDERALALPGYVGVSTAGRFEAAYWPTFHVSRRYAFVFPVSSAYDYRTKRGRIATFDRFRVQLGAGVLYKTYKSFHTGSEFTFQIDSPLTDLLLPRFGFQGSGYFLGGKMRMGVHVPVGEDLRRASFTFGISDFGGLVYWILRQSHHPEP